MEDERLSKKELKEQRKLLKLQQELEGKRQNTIKWVVITLASLLFLGFFIFLLSKGKEKQIKPVDLKISQNDWVRGNKDAKLTLVEFSDFQCPACKRYEPWVQQVVRDYSEKLRFVYKHFPISGIHKNAIAAASAAEAAGKQGKFWEIHDLLFDTQEEWAGSGNVSDVFTSYAKKLSLDIDTFKKDSADKKIEEKITQDRELGTNLGVNSTPTFFLNNIMIDNPASLADFKNLIEKELKQ